MRIVNTLQSCFNICFGICFLCVVVIGVTVIGLAMKRDSETLHHSSIQVTSALLTEFTIITSKNTDTLHYNLVLQIKFRNPNKDYGILHQNIAVMAYYQDKRFVAENYSHMFYQGKNGTSLLKLSFKGQQDMMDTLRVEKELNSKAKHQYSAQVEDNNAGSANNNYDILVRLYLQYTNIPKLNLKKIWKVNSQFICDLKKVPLVKSGNYLPSRFKNTECDSHFLQVYHTPVVQYVW